MYGKSQTASFKIGSLGLNINRVGRPLNYDTQTITHVTARKFLRHSVPHTEFYFTGTGLFTLIGLP
jgi:hypothetical protein